MMMKIMKTGTMKKKMMNKFIFALSLMLCMINTGHASEIIKSANDDWLKLVRQYISADNIDTAEENYKWDRLVKDYQKSPEGTAEAATMIIILG